MGWVALVVRTVGRATEGRGEVAEVAGSEAAAVAVLCLLGTLCEKRPEAAAELRQDGALASVAQHLLQGELTPPPAAVPSAVLPAALRGLLVWLLSRFRYHQV